MKRISASSVISNLVNFQMFFYFIHHVTVRPAQPFHFLTFKITQKFASNNHLSQYIHSFFQNAYFILSLICIFRLIYSDMSLERLRQLQQTWSKRKQPEHDTPSSNSYASSAAVSNSSQGDTHMSGQTSSSEQRQSSQAAASNQSNMDTDDAKSANSGGGGRGNADGKQYAVQHPAHNTNSSPVEPVEKKQKPQPMNVDDLLSSASMFSHVPAAHHLYKSTASGVTALDAAMVRDAGIRNAANNNNLAWGSESTMGQASSAPAFSTDSFLNYQSTHFSNGGGRSSGSAGNHSFNVLKF